MEYLAPRAFAAARPHLRIMMEDDSAAAIDALQARLSKPLSEHLIEQAMKAQGHKPHSAGFETLAWETAAIESLRTFLLGKGTYHRVAASDDLPCAMPRTSALFALPAPIYVEIEGLELDHGFEGASFTPVRITDAQGDEKRDHIQITLWPSSSDQYGRSAPLGRLLTAAPADGDDLFQAIQDGIDIARAAAAQIPLPAFVSRATTGWDDGIEDVVAFHAAAAVAIASSAPVEPQWQDGIKPYLLSKTNGPKGEAGARALLRRGYVRESRHSLAEV